MLRKSRHVYIRFLSIFEKSIEELLHFKRLSARRGGDEEIKKRKHVHHLEIVHKRSIYGMWIEKSIFIKAVLYDPADMLKLSAILEVGSSLRFSQFILL
jgi:hypothetical protein